MTVIAAKNGTVLLAPIYNVLVPANTTVEIDSVLKSSFSVIDYLMSFSNGTNLRTNRLMIRNNGVTVSDQMFGRSGYSFAISVQSTLSGTDFKLSVINNESFSVLARFSKTIV